MSAETVDNVVITVTIKGRVTGSDGAVLVINHQKEVVFTDGATSNQLGQVWQDQVRSLNATTENLDMVGSTNKDFQGNSLDMTGVKLLYFENLDTDTGDYIDVGPDGTNGVPGIMAALGDKVRVQPGGFFLWVAPGVDSATVTASTGDLIAVTAADNSTYKAIVGGKNT